MKHFEKLVDANMKIDKVSVMRSRLGNQGLFLLVAILGAQAFADEAESKGSSADAQQVSAESQQKNFSSPEDAVKALVDAIKQADIAALMKILGQNAKSILESDNIELYRANRDRFLKAFEKAHALVKSNESTSLLEVGDKGWQFPIPIVKNDEGIGWYFDLDAGRQEMENRHIGRNELSTIQAILAYVDAQREYYFANPQQEEKRSYAQKFQSSQGLRDGLYYPVKEGEKPSPLGELYATAQMSGRLKDEDEATQRRAYYGYYYRILTSQGPDAPGGADDYVEGGKMVGGHALIAWPEIYDKTGIKTFIVNHDGIVYERDLGPNTATAVQKIMMFNPDKTWTAVEGTSE